MKKNMSKLTDQQISILKENHEIHSFQNDCDLVYEKQIPNAGIALIDGEIELTKKSKTLEKITSGSLLGVHHLIYQEPTKLGCKVKKDSKIILLGKSEILDSLKDTKSKLFLLLKDFKKKNEEK